MKKIAIKGMSSRGGEIISLLESLGGVNLRELNGYSENLYYYIQGVEIVPQWKDRVPKEYRLLTIDEAIAEVNKKNMETKVCAKCGKVLPVDSFYKSKFNKDGHSSYCKECNNRMSLESRKRKTESVQPKPEKQEHVLHKVYHLPELAKYDPRDLMLELKARGYEGELMYVEVIRKEHRINLNKLN